MATIPTQEQILLQISQSLGIPTGQTRNKKSFIELRKPLDNHGEMIEELLEEIFSYLGLNEEMKKAMFHNVVELFAMNKAIELHTWTYNARLKHILWHWFAHVYVPGIARHVAFWELAKSIDEIMPAIEFWYLPQVKEGKLVLPVQQVMDWVMDLLGSSIKELKIQFKNKNIDEDSIERNLYNWWKKGSLPRENKIEEYFSEDTSLSFNGCFQPDEKLTLKEQFQSALSFVEDKNLKTDELSFQLNLSLKKLEHILSGQCSNEKIKAFVDLLKSRYQQPSLRTIRQKLLIARMMQDAYKKLQKVLTPDVDFLSTNICENKTLQLIDIFQTVYTLTIQSNDQSNDWNEQNQWFENQLPEIYKYDICQSILPSQKGKGSEMAVAETLTHKFEPLNQDSLLEDLVASNKEELPRILKKKILFKEMIQKNRVTSELINDLRTKSPYRTLQKIDSFKVVRSLGSTEGLSSKVKSLTNQRLRELAQTDRERMEVVVAELSRHLNGNDEKTLSITEKTISELIQTAKANSTYDLYKALILQFEAKHHLARNEFDKACKLFNKALKACYERNFGTLRGEIAKDAFATEIANQMVIPNNHEKYLRNMWFYGMIETSSAIIPSVEDVAIKLSKYFWEALYKPYKQYPNEVPESQKQAEKWFKESVELIRDADWKGFDQWMKKHSVALRNKHLRNVRGDTILTLLINIEKQFQPHFLIKDTKNIKSAIYKISKKWKKLINIPDFKGQTPLMLAANDGDYELVKHFLELEGNPNLQDYRGRTSLHVATLSGDLTTVEIILNYNIDTSICAKNNHETVLHSAVASGNPSIVKSIVSHSPNLTKHVNSKNQSPLDIAKAIIREHSDFAQMFRNENRTVGTKENYNEIMNYFSKSTSTN